MMKQMAHALVCLACISSVYGQSFAAPSLILAENRTSAYQIVIPAVPSDMESQAARELRRYLWRISGARVPIVTADKPVSEYEIILGNNERLQALGIAIDWQKLGKEGFTIRTVNKRLVIAGGPVRGTIYGVHTFLEEQLGCRWLAADATIIPKINRIEIKPLDDTQVPVMRFREVYYYEAMDPGFALHNKLNGNGSIQDNGRMIEKHNDWDMWCHTLFALVPPEQYFNEHPEYFALVNGKREPTQLCMTNPDVLKISIEALRKRIEANPSAHYISLSQMDNVQYCQCENCKTIDDREGSPMGSLLEFINEVAAVFPDKAISTLSYQYTRKPPKTIRPAENVVIVLCSIECSHEMPISENPACASFRDDIINWSKICDNVITYDYVIQFSNLVSPFPNFKVLQPDMQFYVEHGAKGMFSQGNRENSGEFAELRSYILAKLQWNPYCDVKQVMQDFLTGYYGAAAKPVEQYIKLMEAELTKSGLGLSIFGSPAHHKNGYTSEANLARYNQLFDEAERLVAQQPEYLKRVRKARMPLMYTMLELGYGTLDERMKILDEFSALMNEVGLQRLIEWGVSPDEFRAKYTSCLMNNDALQLLATQGNGGRITRFALADGKNLLRESVPTEWDFPNIGGYWESWSEGYRALGPGVTFATEKKETPAGQSLVMTSQNNEKIKIERTLTIPKSGAAFEINSQVTNLRAGVPNGGLWSRLELTLGPTDEITAIFPARSENSAISLAMPQNHSTNDIYLTAQDVSQGIILANHKRGLAMRLQPTSPDVNLYWLHVNAKYSAVTFGVQFGQNLLQGQTAEMTLNCEILRNLKGLPRVKAPVFTKHRTEHARFGANRLFLENYGNEDWVENDPTSLSKSVVKITTNHRMWCCGWFIDPGLFEPGQKYEVWARMKVEKSGDEGIAFDAGVWDESIPGSLGQVGMTVEAIADGQWHDYKLAEMTPGPSQYVWCGPANNPDNVSGLWLDSYEFRAIPENK